MHVNVLITRRTDWKSPGWNWISHQVVFIIISQSAISSRRSLLLRINKSYMIQCVSLESDYYWSNCQVKWFDFLRHLFNVLLPCSFDQAAKTQMSSRESQRGHLFLQLCTFDPNPASFYPGPWEQHEMMFMRREKRHAIIYLGAQAHLSVSHLLIFPKEVHVKPSTCMKHTAQYLITESLKKS